MSSSARALRVCRTYRNQLRRPIQHPNTASRILQTRALGSLPTLKRTTKPVSVQLISLRNFTSRETPATAGVDDAMEEIEDAYDAAVEEFQIASEETKDNTIYAADDRSAARSEFDKLKALFDQYMVGESLSAEGKEKITTKAGQRIRELEQALKALEEDAKNQD